MSSPKRSSPKRVSPKRKSDKRTSPKKSPEKRKSSPRRRVPKPAVTLSMSVIYKDTKDGHPVGSYGKEFHKLDVPDDLTVRSILTKPAEMNRGRNGRLTILGKFSQTKEPLFHGYAAGDLVVKGADGNALKVAFDPSEGEEPLVKVYSSLDKRGNVIGIQIESE